MYMVFEYVLAGFREVSDSLEIKLTCLSCHRNFNRNLVQDLFTKNQGMFLHIDTNNEKLVM